jgi:hypothetical protein
MCIATDIYLLQSGQHGTKTNPARMQRNFNCASLSYVAYIIQHYVTSEVEIVSLHNLRISQ